MTFTSSNLMCVYTHTHTHTKFQNMKFCLSVPHKLFKNRTQKVFHAKNRKSELSIDGLIISRSRQSFDVRKRQNKFCKIIQNCNLSTLLNFISLYIMQGSFTTTFFVQNLTFFVSQKLNCTFLCRYWTD